MIRRKAILIRGPEVIDLIRRKAIDLIVNYVWLQVQVLVQMFTDSYEVLM